MFFREVLEARSDPIFGLNEAFLSDNHSDKVNLIVGIYKDDHLKTHLMPSVKKARDQILAQDLLADYLPIDGLFDFCKQIGKLIFGDQEWQRNHGRIYAAQTIGGTGALQVGGQFIAQEVTKRIVCPDPTWSNHRFVFERAGCLIETYPYYSKKQHGVDFNAFCLSLQQIPEKTTVLLHPACHNPTGCDLSIEQWKELSYVMKKKQLLPFFDCAYQGLGEDLEKDRQPIDVFLKDGHEMLVAYSCSKNFSLYCQRLGALFVLGENKATKLRIGSQIRKMIRSLYSNPPAYGARIVSYLLNDPLLKEEWEKELNAMRHRLSVVLDGFVQRLSKRSTRINFQYMRQRKGMFLFMDLEKFQVQRLKQEFGIYLTENGRISLTGLNLENIDRVVHAIVRVCEST